MQEDLESKKLGRYLVGKPIQNGGMAKVYHAQDTDMEVHREVAIKIIASDSSTDTNTKNRQFLREVKAVGQLNHPHILPLLDFGINIHPISGATLAYIVMPVCNDGSLGDWIKKHHSLSFQDIAYIVHQASDALQQAHDKNIVHKDVKPDNFLIHKNNEHPNRPHLWLADFGIARFIDGTATLPDTTQGSPCYMPPEQWENDLKPASDQYALAITAYQLLTGRLPFKGTTPQQLRQQHIKVTPEPPSKYNPLIPAAIDKVILRALAKKPEDRYSSIKDFADAFQKAADASQKSFYDDETLPDKNLLPGPPLPPPPPYRPPIKIVSAFIALALVLILETAILLNYWIHYKPGTSPIATATTIYDAKQTATAFTTATDIADASATVNVLQTPLATTPRVSDPLTSASDTHVANWDGSNGSNRGCRFDPNGYYVITSNEPQQECSNAQYYNPLNHFTITIDMLVESSDSSGGLVFDVQPNGTGYFFEVSPNKQNYKFSILNCNLNNCDLLRGWSKQLPDIIRNGHNINELAVIVNGNHFSFWVNRSYLTDYTDNNNNFSNGYLSLVSHDTNEQGTIKFSNLNIYP